MNTDCHIIVIDDHEIIATGCQGEFAKAGLPWSVIWARNLSDIDWPEGQTLAVLDLRLNDGSRPAEIIAELSRRSIPVVVYTTILSTLNVRNCSGSVPAGPSVWA